MAHGANQHNPQLVITQEAVANLVAQVQAVAGAMTIQAVAVNLEVVEQGVHGTAVQAQAHQVHHAQMMVGNLNTLYLKIENHLTA